MLTPDYLDHIADDIVDLYAKLDESIAQDIARRIVKTGTITETGKLQFEALQNSGLLYDDIVKQVSKISMVSQAELREKFKEAGLESVKYDAAIYEAAGLQPLPLGMSPGAVQVLKAQLAKTGGLLRNLTKTTARTTQQAYISACALAEMQVSSGAFDYNTAIRNAVRSSIQQGAWVEYPTGSRSRLDVAVRRSVLTGVNQTSLKITEAYADDMGCDLVETTAHGGARPKHAAWQGQVFSRSGKSKAYPGLREVTGYGTGPGLGGWNCRHSFHPYIEGVSTPAYPKELLESYEAKRVTYNHKQYTDYEASQIQRSMERGIRDTKRQILGYDAAAKAADDPTLKAGLQADFSAAAQKLKRQEARMQDFLRQTGRLGDGSRVQVHGFGRSQAQKAAWASKKALQSRGTGAIIKSEELKTSILQRHQSMLKPEHLSEMQKIIGAIDDPRLLDLYDKMSYNFKGSQYYGGGGYYSPMDRKVVMDMDSNTHERHLANGHKGAWQTKFHEEFHQLDHILSGGTLAETEGGLYFRGAFTNTYTKIGSQMADAIQKDILSAVNDAVQRYNAANGAGIKSLKSLARIPDETKLVFARDILSTYSTDRQKAQISIFTDAMGLSTKDRLSLHSWGLWGHSTQYNKDRGIDGATSETWATFGALIYDKDAETMKIVEKLMPETMKVYRSALEKVLQYVYKNPLKY